MSLQARDGESGSGPKRRAGLVMPLFSLRSDAGWGVGEIPDLEAFSRWAASAGFSAIMLLPFHELWPGETSPYGAVTAFALDPAFLRIGDCEDFLALGGEAEALSAQELHALQSCRKAPSVQWQTVRALKIAALKRMFERFSTTAVGTPRRHAFDSFCRAQAGWLDDYALYHALATEHGPGWGQWPQPLRDRDPEALAAAGQRLSEHVEFRKYVEWLLSDQWTHAQAQAEKVGVAFGGDLPFVVSRDAADVWANQACFRLDLRLGAPPDDFSAEGQDWGLPVYDWDKLRQTDFAWMRARAQRSNSLCTLWRIDHVVGLFRSYYQTSDGRPPGFLPPDEPSQIAQGRAALHALEAAGDVLAEDLGVIPEFVRTSLRQMKIPGFKVLRWERDGLVHRDPATWDPVSVATTGTHDTDTQVEWWDTLKDNEREAILRLPGLEAFAVTTEFNDSLRDALLRLVYAAPSSLMLVPFQDVLGLRGRVNLPGSVSEANWTYRMPMTLAQLEADTASIRRLADLARLTHRFP